MNATQEARERAAGEVVESTREVCDEEGLSLRALIRKLKAELNWKETKTIKLKGAVRQKDLPRGFKVIATTGTIIETEDGRIAGDGETLILWEEKSGGVRQRARMNAHDLRGDYPSKDIKNQGIDLNRPLTPEERACLRESVLAEIEAEKANGIGTSQKGATA